jgi:hypothetical protein
MPSAIKGRSAPFFSRRRHAVRYARRRDRRRAPHPAQAKAADQKLKPKKQGVTVFRIALHLLLALCSSACLAQDIATCNSPAGIAYFADTGALPKSGIGWKDDQAAPAKFTIRRLGTKDFDIFSLGANKEIISAKQQGAHIFLLRASPVDAAFLVAYDEGVSEIYTLFTEMSGQGKVGVLSSRSGPQVALAKQSATVGTCGAIRFNLIP